MAIYGNLVGSGGGSSIVGGGGSSANLNVTLMADDWIDNTQTVNVNGITEYCTVIVGGDWGSEPQYTNCAIHCAGQGNGTLTFKCSYPPSDDIVANVAIL